MRIHSRAILLAVGGLLVGSIHSLTAQVVLYEHPAVAEVTVHREVIPESTLEVDLYYPPESSDTPTPVVVFVLAFPDSGALGPMRQLQPYPSWARLLAAEGLVGVLYQTSDPEADLLTVMTFLSGEAGRLGIDPGRVGLWSASGNTALALKYARAPRPPLRPAAFVAYYGVMPTPDQYQAAELESMSASFGFTLPTYEPGEQYPLDLPMLLVRAGSDSWTEILKSIDRFVGFSFQENLSVTVRNYPEGQHGFDFQDDTNETRAIIRQTLAFLRGHLAGG